MTMRRDRRVLYMAAVALAAAWTQAQDVAAAAPGMAGVDGGERRGPADDGAAARWDGAYLASGLLKSRVANAVGDSIGAVSDLVVDRSGRVSHVVVDTSETFQVESEFDITEHNVGSPTALDPYRVHKYLVPFDRVTLLPESDWIRVDVTGTELSAEFARFEEVDEEIIDDLGGLDAYEALD